MLAVLLVTAIVLFVLAYRIYGAWIARKLGLNDDHSVPSEFMFDGTDYVPAKTPVLFGHHFSSIAGAGPIVGPILAGLFFGWLPAVIWIVLGSIFVGGVHDFGSMVASVRHKARSVAELAKDYMTPLSFRLFLAFIWLTMIYVIVVFMDLTAVSFIDARDAAGAETAQGTGVAVASGIFIVLAILLGVVNNRTKIPVWASTLIFVPALLVAIGLSTQIHSDGSYIPAFFADSQTHVGPPPSRLLPDRFGNSGLDPASAQRLSFQLSPLHHGHRGWAWNHCRHAGRWGGRDLAGPGGSWKSGLQRSRAPGATLPHPLHHGGLRSL